MTSKNSTTLKPQSDSKVAEELVAGGCSSEPSSCDRGWLLPELCGLDQDNGRHSMSERGSCASTEGEIPDNHQHQQNGGNNGGKTSEEEPPTRADLNVFGNEYPGIHNGEGGGGGGNGNEGTFAVRKKRTWTAEEDEKLKRAVEEHGSGNWMIIERCSGLGRTSKSCRLRWTNHLRPNLKKGSFTEAEERIVVMLHQKYGNKWSFIASKLPGRTDNEVKNFWHGRLRRCRKQYLDVYPPILGDEKYPLINLNSSRSHFHDDIYSSAATDYPSHISQFSFVQLEQQQNPTSCYTSHKPFSSSTSPNQNQLLSPNQVPVSSPHGLSSSHQLQSPKLHTTQMHPLPINMNQSQLPSNVHSKLSSEPPPVNFSSPEQISVISIPSSSVSSHRLRGSSLISQVSSLFNSITEGSPTHSAGRHISLKQPTTTPSKLDTSSLPSPVSCNQKTSQVNIPTTASPHSPLDLKVTTPLPSDSHFQVNTSMISSLTSSPICISSNLELLVTSPSLELLTEMLGLAKPYSLGFELPPSQSSPSHFNSASLSSPSAVKPELPSFQYPENAFLSVQDVTTNLQKTDTENSGAQDAHIQEAPAKTDLLYPTLTEEDSLDRSLENKISSGKIFKNGKTTDNSSNENTFLHTSKRKEGFICEGWETINSSGSQVLRKNLHRKLMVNKRLKTEILRGKISRREGSLAEISKTGVLLVENAKKERLISKLLNESSKPDIVLSQSPKTENLQFGEIFRIKDILGNSLSIEDLLTDIYKEKGLRDEKSDEDDLLAANTTLLETKNLHETLFDKSSSESVLLTSCEQEIHDLDVLDRQTHETNLLKPDGTNNELNSVQVGLDQVLDKISRRDDLPGFPGQEHELKTIDAVFSHITSTNQLKSGNGGGDLSYVGSCGGDCLSKNLKEEFMEQVHVGGHWDDRSNEDSLLALQDQHTISDDSSWGIGQYIFSNTPSSVCPEVESSCIIPSAGELLEEGQRTENSWSRNLKKKGSEDKSSRKRPWRESSTERVNGLQELTLNDFLPLTTQSTTSHLLSSDVHCPSTYPSGITVEEDEHINILPEELSSLLEFFPTFLPEWNDIRCNTSSK